MASITARYEATVATGLEDVAQEEIIQKLSNVKTVIQKGRVLIETNLSTSNLLKLKTINNLFVIIYDQVFEDEQMPQNAEQLEALLMEVGDQCDWHLGLIKWNETTTFDGNDLDKIMTKNSNLRDVQPKFRVSSNRSGSRHKFTSPEICCTFGHVIDTRFGWPIKMKNYDLEVYANFNENRLYVQLTLTPQSLANRNIISTGYTTLRAATCYALLRKAEVQNGDIVLDPLAGSGAIPVENMIAWDDQEWCSFTLASDLGDNVVSKSQSNMKASRAPSDVMRFDATKGALRDNSIDVIVSDLPFGKRHGSKAVNKILYPKLMIDFGRMSTTATGRAVLLTQDFKSMNTAIEKAKDYWIQKSCSYVKIGNLDCWIYVFYRTATSFQPILS